MPENRRRPPERLHIPNTSKRPPSSTEVVSHPGRSPVATSWSSVKPEDHSSQQGERLEWLSENFLKPLSDAASRYIIELQKQGVAPQGDPLIIYNMVRVSSGTLIALALELQTTSGLDIRQPEKLDELADLIVRIFLPGAPADS